MVDIDAALGWARWFRKARAPAVRPTATRL